MSEVAGVDLKTLVDPIEYALVTYQELSYHRDFSEDDSVEEREKYSEIQFDLRGATNLQAMPEESFKALSESPVRMHDDFIGKLLVMVFNPGETTGFRSQPVGAQSVHLTILTQNIENPQSGPQPFAGTYDLYGLDETKINVGQLGHKSGEPEEDSDKPLVTYVFGPDSTLGGIAALRNYKGCYGIDSPSLENIQVSALFVLFHHGAHNREKILDGWKPQSARLT